MMVLQYHFGAIVTAVIGFLLFIELPVAKEGKNVKSTNSHAVMAQQGIVKVFSEPASVCTARVHATLEEKGVEYELVPLSFHTDEHKKQPYLAKNVPAFQDGHLVIFGSCVISKYIARKYKGKGTGCSTMSKNQHWWMCWWRWNLSSTIQPSPQS